MHTNFRTPTKALKKRGTKTLELPFLMSCALHLLDRRYWIIGVRYPWYGVRFDLVVRDPANNDSVALIEAKYRSDQRPVRPYEIERFRNELANAMSAGTSLHSKGYFMTNTSFSQRSLELAKRYGIRTFSHIPLLFELRNKRTKEKSESNGAGAKNHPLHQL